MTHLVGFKLNRIFPLLSPFYCLDCSEALSSEKRWRGKSGQHRKGVVPLVEFDGGVVRCLRVPASNFWVRNRAGEWPIDDDGLSLTEETALQYMMAVLGLRIVPSLPQPAELDIACKKCDVGLLRAPRQRLTVGGWPWSLFSTQQRPSRIRESDDFNLDRRTQLQIR